MSKDSFTLIFRPVNIILFSIFYFLLSSPLSAMTEKEKDLYWWGFTYGQLEGFCFLYKSGSISRSLSKTLSNDLIKETKEKFIDKGFHEALVKSFRDPKNSVHLCKDLYYY